MRGMTSGEEWRYRSLKSPIGAQLIAATLLMMPICECGMAQAAQATAAPAAVSATQPTKASAVMQPSLDNVLRTLDDLRPDKWKTSGAMRQETQTNIDSIRQDLTSTLPPLLATADRAPDSVAEVLPAYRNIEALYDVLLRVTETGRLSAPRDQADALNQALTVLETGRRTLGERLQTAAVAREQHVHTLEAAARAAAAAPKPVATPCPAPVTHTTRHRTRKKTTAKKPATTTNSTSSQSGTASH